MTRPGPVVLPGPGDRQAEEAVAMIRERSGVEPEFAVILGSGLGGAVSAFEVSAELSFEGLPGFPPAAVPGHPGRLLLGRLGGHAAMAFAGRLHYHEGHPMSVCGLPVRVAALLGAGTIVLTASVGALDPSLVQGQIVVAEDHLNFMGDNPIRGWRDADGSPSFVDMSETYDRDLLKRAESAAADLGLEVARGVYAAVAGPSYETPAEIDWLHRAGGTVVGMSVVPEAVPARALGTRVLGLFVVTNTVGGPKLDHRDVLRVAESSSGPLGRLLLALAPDLAEPT